MHPLHQDIWHCSQFKPSHNREDFPFIPINQYVGLSNYPDQVRKKNSLRGFSFNLMVLGESGLGKTTFVNSMFNSDILPVRKGGAMPEKKFTTTSSSTLSFCSTRAQIREGEETLNLTVVEAKGFGDQLDNQQSWIPILDEIQRRNEEYLRAEFSPHPIHLAADERIHACIYFVAPLGCGLRKLDVEVMQKIGKAVNLIPVIAKADTFTLEELREFKVQVLREIEHFNIQVYQPVPKLTPTNSMQMNEELELLAERITNKIPFAVVGSNESVFLNEYEWRARQYPWGNVLVEAAEEEAFHDFLALRQLLIGELMVALKEHAEQNLFFAVWFVFVEPWGME